MIEDDVFGEQTPADVKLAQTHVWHKGKGFFVSTINRRSSAALAYDRIYAETIVWEWDDAKRERGRMLAQDGACEGSLSAHQKMVERIFKTGVCKEPDHD